MPQAKAGAQSGKGPARPLVQPLSPHLQIWRWHITMWGSILHRASGVALYVGALVLVAWAACIAAGPDAYGLFAHVGASIVGLVVWFGLTLALFYHFAAGVRHLIWDTGMGFKLQTADMMSWFSIVFAVVGSVALWAWLLAAQHVVWSGRVLL